MSRLRETCLVLALVNLFIYQASAFYTQDTLPLELHRHAQDTGLLEDNFVEFDVTSLVYDSTTHAGRQKRHSGFQHNGNVTIQAFGEIFALRLRKTPGVLHPAATVKFSSGDEVTSLPHVPRDCSWEAEVLSHGGFAVFSTCGHRPVGNLVAGEHQYHIHSMPPRDRYRLSSADFNREAFIVARKPFQDIMPLQDADYEIENHIRSRRQVDGEKPRNITIESAIYIDAMFTERLVERGITSPEDQLDFILLKWNWMEFSCNLPELGYMYTVDVQVKFVQFYVTNPEWYDNSTQTQRALNSFCQFQKDGLPYDLLMMHSGIRNADVGGRGYLGGLCKTNNRCGIVLDSYWGGVWLLAHELGHLFNMVHRPQTPCANNITEFGGIMTGPSIGWSPCAAKTAHTFIQGDTGNCLYEENVPMPAQDVIELSGLLPGMYKTRDESCEEHFGLGFRYLLFPYSASIEDCDVYGCVNTNVGPRYGEMLRRGSVPGLYCGPGKACSVQGQSCVPYDELYLKHPVPVRQGGWSAYEPFLPASRSCGTGAIVSRRKCNNPTPLNTKDCEGEEYRAELVNTQACPGDVDDFATMLIQRAGEVCRKLLRNGILDSTIYAPTGVRYWDSAIGQCEVKCDRLQAGGNPMYSRWGLYDDGVPCDLGLESSDWSRATGLKGHCIRGHCKAFGCDGKFPGKTVDKCGVCGGDNSTCDVISYVNMMSDPGNRFILTDIPAGAYNIEIVMSRQSGGAPRLHLELWSKDDKEVMAQYSGNNGISNTQYAAISFAGAQWDFDSREYLLAKGPINQPLLVKISQTSTAVNDGINIDFSLPLANRICTGTCKNGGTWWKCGCQCPSGFGGIDCGVPTNKVCFNGEEVDPVSGECQCNSREYGDYCACRLPFKGDHCATCKITSCFNCGTFNLSTCVCDCPVGYGGLQCKVSCKDNQWINCANKKANGFCHRAYEEEVCPATCGYCQPLTNSSAPLPQCDPQPIPLTECTPSEFQCGNGSCIDIRLLNNGEDDCEDGSDETETSSGSEVDARWSLGFGIMSTFIFLQSSLTQYFDADKPRVRTLKKPKSRRKKHTILIQRETTLCTC